MRILHVLAERGFSGGENQLLATIRYLRERGHEQLLLHDDRARFPAHVRDLGVACHATRIRGNFDPRAALALRRHFRQLAPDLVHLACSRSHKLGALAGIAGGSLPPKVVTRRMDYPIGNTAFRRWLYRDAVAGVVAISTGVRQAILDIGVPPDHIHLIHEGVDTERLGALREPSRRAAARLEMGLRPTDVLGLTLASLHHRKAHDVLIAALTRLQLPPGQRLVWLFGGEGPERGALERRIGELLSNPMIEVRMPGRITAVEDALSAADLFCLPSRYEGLGVALLEALAAGVPCIASEVGGMRDVFVHEESGLHVPPGDPTPLAAAIQRCLDGPDFARRLGEAGIVRAREEFDVSTMGGRTEALYSILARPPARPAASTGGKGIV